MAKYKIGDTVQYNSFGTIVQIVVDNVVDIGDGNPMYEDAEGNVIFENAILVLKKQI